ncbi:MAG: AraC family transcriptional regulator [Victivallales bacterium]
MLKKTTKQEKAAWLRSMLAVIPLKHHFRVHWCYNLIVSPNWKIAPRVIDDMHLLFVKGGSGTYLVDGVEEKLSRGKVIFIPPGVEHSGWQHPASPPEIIPVRFHVYTNEGIRPVPNACPPSAIAFIPADTLHMEALFESLYNHTLLLEDQLHERMCSSLLQQIMIQLAIELERGSADRDMRIEQVRRTMKANPLKRLPIDKLSRQSGLSRKYFTLKFRKQTGMSPKNYQVRLRLNQARYLLQTTGTGVKEVAGMLDYPDPYIFSKQFKQFFGYPPKEVVKGN